MAVVDLDADQPVRQAFIGADQGTLFEAGSLTKALTGLALADSVEYKLFKDAEEGRA